MNVDRRSWLGPYRQLDEAKSHQATCHEPATYLIVVDYFDRVFVVPTERVEEFVDFVRLRALRDGVDLKQASLWVQ